MQIAGIVVGVLGGALVFGSGGGLDELAGAIMVLVAGYLIGASRSV